MSTRFQPIQDAAASSLTQRSCKRPQCCSPSSASDGADSNQLPRSCCDETCLVELARRGCDEIKCHHNLDNVEPSQEVFTAKTVKGSSSQPCERHYNETKSRYGGILDNLGCICKVLLSINIEPCCVIPSHASIRSRRSHQSDGSDASSRIPQNANSGKESVSFMKTLPPDSCGGTSCCGGDDLLSPETAIKPNASSCESQGCCGTKAPTDDGKSPPKDGDCPNASCCGDSIEGKVYDSAESSCLQGCCGSKSDAITKAEAPTENHYDGDGCCEEEDESEDDAANTSLEDCSKGGCCTTKAAFADEACSREGCCSSGEESQPTKRKCCSQDNCCGNEIDGDSPTKQHCTVLPSANNLDEISTKNAVPTHPTSGFDEIDIEKATFSVEHVTVSVSGMTCTGCEKKLYRSLDSFPTTTNIKTSLLLAQAEFDLSGTVDAVELLKSLEKMTGFTCAKMGQSGQVLDIIVDGNAYTLAQKDMPYGVIDLEVLNESTIRVTYQPKLIGARDLLSDLSFPSGRLAPVADRPMIASGRAHVKDMLFKTILSAVLTIPVLVMAWAPIHKRPVLFGAISLGLATAALLFSRMIEMDLLIVISTITAYIYSVIAYAFVAAGSPLSTGEFFETSTLLVTLIMVGRLASTALLVHPKYDEEIDTRLLQYSDKFRVTPDSSVATDGIVVSGESEVDESMITGEAALVAKKPGSSVVAGSINYSGTLIVQLTRIPGENTISSIGTMVDEAKSSKPRIQRVADRVAGYFVPVILLITAPVFIIWVLIGKAVRHRNATNACIKAMTYAVSALIVSCPCAIGLAVPMVVVIAGGVAAKHGLIFKTAETIEIARKLTHVVFDKTGTLTQGLLSVEIEEYPNGKASIPAPVLLGLTKDNKHPVSVAIAAHLQASGVQLSDFGLEGVVSVAGKGVQGKWNGNTVLAGNPYWLCVEDPLLVREALQLGLSIFCVSLNGELVSVFGLRDHIRPDAFDIIQQLHERSIKVSIVSGDNEESVKSVARLLDIPENNIRFKCNPEEKSQYVKELLSPKRAVMFCGDGTNDAVALAQANIGMHINGGTDIAQSRKALSLSDTT